MNIHYALQTCDTAVRDTLLDRYCECSKTEITKKCVTSFLNSAKVLSEKTSEIYQTIAIFDDNSTDETVNYLKECVKHYSLDKIKIEFYSFLASCACTFHACFKHNSISFFSSIQLISISIKKLENPSRNI